jgi:hypothetical protein
VEQLNYYSKHGIPQPKEQQVEAGTDEGNWFGCFILSTAVCFNRYV